MPRVSSSAAARRYRRALAALILVTALPAEAQRAREEAEFAKERASLERRGRGVLHPGEPLQLVGVGAGDADVLARTPALANATLGLMRVDREELRARKLALYDGAASFDGAPRSLGPVAESIERETARRVEPARATNPGAEAEPPATTWPWVVGAIVALMFCLRRAVVTQGRRSAAP
jgi:hypothetical protein